MSQSSSSVQDVPRSTTRSNLSRPPCFCIILLASSSPTDACTWMSDHPGSFVESASVECMRISFQERPKSSSASPHIPGIPQISADDSCITSHVIINALTLCMFVKYVFFCKMPDVSSSFVLSGLIGVTKLAVMPFRMLQSG